VSVLKSEESRLLFFDKKDSEEAAEKEKRTIDHSVKFKNNLKAVGEWIVKILSSFVVCLVASLLVTIIFNSVQEDVSLASSFDMVIGKIKEWVEIYL
jgi:hypothetical protein